MYLSWITGGTHGKRNFARTTTISTLTPAQSGPAGLKGMNSHLERRIRSNSSTLSGEIMQKKARLPMEEGEKG